jgi:lipoprotein-releasing system permease protein
MAVEFFIGKRYLFTRQKEAFVSLITLLSTLGVAVGVMVLIVVIAVMTGFETEVMHRMLNIEAHVFVGRYGNPMTAPEEIQKTIKTIDGVQSAVPFVYSQAMLRSSSGVSVALLRGIEPQNYGCLLKTVSNKCIGSALNSDKTQTSSMNITGVILGVVLAEKLNVQPGDRLHLLSALNGSGGGRVPSIKRIKVLDLIKTGMNEYDGNMAFLAINDLQGMLNMGSTVTGIEVRIENIFAARDLAEKISEKLDIPYWSQDWMQMHKNLFSMLKLQKVVMFIILTLIVLVAAFNIASTLIMMVMEKNRDIAILKTMGATNKSIRRIFVYKGMAIGLIGTALGLGLGIILCGVLQHYQFIELPGDVYPLDTLPVQLEIIDTIIIVSATLFICFIAALYPAQQAARFNPVDGIRYG